MSDRIEPSAEYAQLLRLTEHLASEAFAFGDEDCTLTGFSGSGRCIEPAVAVRWEDGFADPACEQHALRAAERGALIVWPSRHDGTLTSLSNPPGGLTDG